MRKLLSLGFLLTLAGVPGLSQTAPRWNVAAGYTYEFAQDGSGNDRNLNGGSASVAYNFNRWIGAAAEVTVTHSNDYGVGNILQSYTAGPRFSYRRYKRVTPFADTLVGYGRNNISLGNGEGGYSVQGFALSVNGGADYALGSSRRFALRPEIGYAFFANHYQVGSFFRASVGVVYNIGKIDKKK